MWQFKGHKEKIHVLISKTTLQKNKYCSTYWNGSTLTKCEILKKMRYQTTLLASEKSVYRSGLNRLE